MGFWYFDYIEKPSISPNPNSVKNYIFNSHLYKRNIPYYCFIPSKWLFNFEFDFPSYKKECEINTILSKTLNQIMSTYNQSTILIDIKSVENDNSKRKINMNPYTEILIKILNGLIIRFNKMYNLNDADKPSIKYVKYNITVLSIPNSFIEKLKSENINNIDLYIGLEEPERKMPIVYGSPELKDRNKFHYKLSI